ncbi:hypothetical protein ACEWY4_028071 [Coilia grayii]|uniref:Myb/SANT-like DNA-binding domain-containing protein n=1 Tax=Coilia grayii TaxID=363190 RepID=A0ABD1IMT4_9TELE
MAGDEEMRTSAAVPRNEVFTKDQTLFLIDLMRQRLEEDGGEAPKSLKELNARIKMGKGSKKVMWKEMAEKLGGHFHEHFDPEKVARKWGTLEEAYKKVKDNNRGTGRSAMRFQYFNEMEELLGGHHDIDYPVVGHPGGLDVRRPDLLEKRSPPPITSRCRRSEDGEFLAFMQEAEASNERRHQEMLDQMKTSQQSFEAIVKSFLAKQ